MGVDIHPIKMGVDTCYLLASTKGAVVVDGGMPGRDKAFAPALVKIGFDPSRIRLVVVTHAHWDHFGCLNTICELTGAKVAAHLKAKDRVESGTKVMPAGITLWGQVLGALLAAFMKILKIPPRKVDIVIGDDGLSLEEYGIPGRVLHTPGHSPGSVSVLLDSGEAFVGDLAMNGPPLTFGPNLPIFAEDKEDLATSWRKLLDAGATEVFPAHWKSFPAQLMRKHAA